MSRSDNDWETWLKVAGVVGYFVVQALSGLKKRRGETPPAPAPPPALEPFRDALHGAVTALVTRAEAAASQAHGLHRRLAMVQTSQPVRVLGDAVEVHVRAPAQVLVRQLDTLARAVAAAPDLATLQHLDADGVRLGLREAVEQLDTRLQALTLAADARVDRERAGLIADAEAVAMDLLEPLRQFARRQSGNPLTERPICLPAGEGEDSVWRELLPGNPLIVVPSGLADSLPRWAALPHEIGHVVHRRWPGYADEAREALAGTRRGPASVEEGERPAAFDAEDTLTAWHEEMLADAFTALTFGPAALQGMVACFARPDAPTAVWRAEVRGGRSDQPPPAQLRVLWMAWLLERMAFEIEPRVLLGAWGRTHGRVEEILLVDPEGGERRVPLAGLLEAGIARLEVWYSRQWACFAEHTLADIPGLEMTPGLWNRVRESAVELVRGEPVLQAPRLVLAAAVVASGLAPSAIRGIAAAARASIQGAETGERRPRDGHYQVGAPQGRPRGGLGELQAALILREVLTRRPAGARRFTGRSGRWDC